MSGATLVHLRTADPGLRELILDRPPVNALGRALVDALEASLDALARDEGARCLVLRSSGAHFCAGADLKERKTMTPDEVLEFVPRLAGICSSIATLPFPTIAAIRGAAAGGGCELALACDVRMLGESARIGLPETTLAIIPGAGGTQRLTRIAGASVAKRWIFSGRMHDAATALAARVADRVVPDDELDAAALDLAREFASSGPLAVRLAKRAIDAGADVPIEEGLRIEWERYQETLATDDRVEALRAFAEKRPPRFSGR